MPNAPLRVLTLNLWHRMGPWPERLAIVRQGIAELSPDVIGLQEVLRSDDGDKLDQLAQISEGFGYHAVFGRTPGQGYPFGNGVLSRWPISTSHVFALPSGGTDELRNVTYALIDAPFGKLPFFTTHLNWKLHEGHVRELQVREVAERVRQLAPISGFPPVVTGDFNAEPEADEVRFMRGLTSLGGARVYFADCFGIAGDGSAGATFCRRNPYAAEVHEPDRRIDYVFVRGPDDRFRGEPLSAKVVFDQPKNGAWASDHFGVFATIST